MLRLGARMFQNLFLLYTLYLMNKLDCLVDAPPITYLLK